MVHDHAVSPPSPCHCCDQDALPDLSRAVFRRWLVDCFVMVVQPTKSDMHDLTCVYRGTI